MFLKDVKTWEGILIDEKYFGTFSEVAQVQVTNFVVFDEENHLVSIDNGIMNRGIPLKIQGYVKPIYSDDNTLEGGDYCKEINGLNTWFISGFELDNKLRITLMRSEGMLRYKML